MPFDIYCPDFEDGDTLPVKFTKEGDNINPRIEILDAPTDTKTFVVLLDNLDEEIDEVTHWIVWNIPSHTVLLEEDELPDDAIEGYNDFGIVGYNGPSANDNQDQYQFRVYALDVELDLDEDASRNKVEKEIAGHILDEAVISVTY